MLFNHLVGNMEIDEKSMKINSREAVRAVIVENNKILLIHSNGGDYKFPGGGVEKGETQTEGLLREMAEETGYIHCVVKDKIGVVMERHLDEYEENAYFQMTSHYYICELTNHEKVGQQLDDYECAQEFAPIWVTLDEAIAKNEKILKQVEKNSWINRESYVLKELKRVYE